MEQIDQVLTLKTADKKAAKRLMDDIEEHLDAGELGLIDIAMAWKTASGRTHMKYLHDHSRMIGAIIGIPLGLGTIAIGYFIGRSYSFHHHDITTMVREITEHLDTGGAAIVVRTDGVGAGRLQEIIADEHSEIEVSRQTFTAEMDQDLADGIEKTQAAEKN